MKTKQILAAALLTLQNSFGQGTINYKTFPLGLEAQNGNGHDINFQVPADRQEWFRGTYLAQVWTTPVLITDVAFRVNEQSDFARGIDTTIPRIEIAMSSTDRVGSNLGDWNQNAGPDARTVFASDSVVISSPGGPGPNPFEIKFHLEEPFYFDPSAFNLVMRVQTIGSGEFPGGNFIDVQTASGGLANAPFAGMYRPIFSGPVEMVPVTQFGWIAVPEPSGAALLGIGLTVWFSIRKRN